MRAIKQVLPGNVTQRELIVLGVVVVIGLMTIGQTTPPKEQLKSTIESIGNFISIIVLGVAVPNGAYGFLQYMTAGSNVDQDEKGRKRIRNTFIALAGVALIQIAVQVFANFVSLSPTTP